MVSATQFPNGFIVNVLPPVPFQMANVGGQAFWSPSGFSPSVRPEHFLLVRGLSAPTSFFRTAVGVRGAVAPTSESSPRGFIKGVSTFLRDSVEGLVLSPYSLLAFVPWRGGVDGKGEMDFEFVVARLRSLKENPPDDEEIKTLARYVGSSESCRAAWLAVFEEALDAAMEGEGAGDALWETVDILYRIGFPPPRQDNSSLIGIVREHIEKSTAAPATVEEYVKMIRENAFAQSPAGATSQRTFPAVDGRLIAVERRRLDALPGNVQIESPDQRYKPAVQIAMEGRKLASAGMTDDARGKYLEAVREMFNYRDNCAPLLRAMAARFVVRRSLDAFWNHYKYKRDFHGAAGCFKDAAMVWRALGEPEKAGELFDMAERLMRGEDIYGPPPDLAMDAEDDVDPSLVIPRLDRPAHDMALGDGSFAEGRYDEAAGYYRCAADGYFELYAQEEIGFELLSAALAALIKQGEALLKLAEERGEEKIAEAIVVFRDAEALAEDLSDHGATRWINIVIRTIE